MLSSMGPTSPPRGAPSRASPSSARRSPASWTSIPNAAITVVVDATFGHRIDKKEVKEFEEGISNNELVAPRPARSAAATRSCSASPTRRSAVLSNDSFQEFHGDYEWLFDDGRLIGGKPVPHVGWVFVDRIPVRGPVSRKATRGSGGVEDEIQAGAVGSVPRSGVERRRRRRRRRSEPMPVPTAPPPRARPAADAARERAAKADGRAEGADGQRAAAVPRVRRAPPGRDERQRHRRRVLLARRLHHDRRQRRARLRAAAADGRPAAAECTQGDEAR